MSQHDVFTKTLSQVMRNTLGQPACIHEHQRCTVGENQLRNAIVKLSPHFITCNRSEFVLRNFNRQVQLPPVSSVDDLDPPLWCNEFRYFLNRPHSRRQSYALWRPAPRFHDEIVQASGRQRQVRTSFVVNECMDFIDDERLCRLQQMAAALSCEQDEQRLWRRYKNMWRPLEHLLPFGHRGLACSDSDADGRHQKPFLTGELSDFVQRAFQIFLDVVAQRFKRRNVNNLRLVDQGDWKSTRL